MTDEERCIQYGVAFDPGVTRQQVYERSQWKCHLCGARVRKSLKYPHPRSASLDHVIPLSWRERSPGHVWENVALAHLVCNQRKGAHYAGSLPWKLRLKYSYNPVFWFSKYRVALWLFTISCFWIGMPAELLAVCSVLCILDIARHRRPSRRRGH
jgi:hypothetical protein